MTYVCRAMHTSKGGEKKVATKKLHVLQQMGDAPVAVFDHKPTLTELRKALGVDEEKQDINDFLDDQDAQLVEVPFHQKTTTKRRAKDDDEY